MTFDAELHDLAGRAVDAHVRSDGFATAAVKGRVRRARRVRTTAAAAGTLAVVALVSTLGVAAAQDWWERPAPADTPTPAPTEIGPTPVPEVEPVLAGWQDAGVDPDVFGDATVTSAVSVDGRAVVVGCAAATGTPVGFPAWVADDPTTWRRADPPPTIAFDQLGECLRDVVATPYGLFAHGFGLYHSADGEAWEQVSLDSALAAPGTFVMAVFAVGDRVTVLGARATDEGAVVSTLVSTTDGVTWTEVTRDLAAVFDDASVVDVVSTGDGLLAVGNRNLGTTEAERGTAITASAWVSTDGLTWALVTPEGPGFDGCDMGEVAVTAAGYAAIGSCPFGSMLMTAWSSPDGTTWSQDAQPAAEGEGSLASQETTAVTLVGEDLYATGQDYDPSRLEDQSQGALWRKLPGGQWERVDVTETGVVPFLITEVDGTAVGFWPGAGWPISTPVRVLVPAE